MKAILKYIVGCTYKPLLEKYLSKTRIYNYGNIRLEIPPQVFHPGFFFSTQLLLQYSKGFALEGKKLLELGAGSGLISIYAAQHGANVTATDINPVAVEYLHKNSVHNNVRPEIIHSDLFQAIPAGLFDIIIINPPYYRKTPQTLIDHAWFCGEKGEYFHGLFSQLGNYIHQDTQITMVLCEGCDTGLIENAAADNHFRLHCMETRANLLERNFIYKIHPA